jgi:putative FmdB family regulatory protein
MPFYVYQCDGCGKVFEVRASIKEKETGLKLACPKCGGHRAHQRLTSAVALRGGPKSSPPNCGPNSGPGCCG